MVYVDNQDCIELIETKNNGIFHLLDEESKFPSSSRRITTPCTPLLRASSKKVAIRSSKVRFRLVHLPHRWTTSCLHPLSVNPYLGNVSRSSILRQRQWIERRHSRNPIIMNVFFSSLRRGRNKTRATYCPCSMRSSCRWSLLPPTSWRLFEPVGGGGVDRWASRLNAH